MIIYLDTSSLIKLYVEEAHSAAVRGLCQAATALLTCRITYAEARSALARRYRAGDLTNDQYRHIVAQLDDDWGELFVIDFDELLAGELAERHAIRGFDAIHLAAALGLDRDPEIDLRFSTYDARLQTAATSENISPP